MSLIMLVSFVVQSFAEGGSNRGRGNGNKSSFPGQPSTLHDGSQPPTPPDIAPTVSTIPLDDDGVVFTFDHPTMPPTSTSNADSQLEGSTTTKVTYIINFDTKVKSCSRSDINRLFFLEGFHEHFDFF